VIAAQTVGVVRNVLTLLAIGLTLWLCVGALKAQLFGAFVDTGRQSWELESLGFAQNFLSSCELEALHFIGIGSFGEEFREDVVFRGIQEQFRKPLA